jgi:secondary thiamine-phosphate synthase enzyme
MPVMSVHTFREHLKSKGETEVQNITALAEKALIKSGLHAGILNVFVPGSTAGITTIEFESGAIHDLRAAIERLAPSSINYSHDARWGDGNGYSHVRAALLKPGLSIPFEEGRLLLGTWQQLVFIDFDNRPRNREIILQVVGE